MVATSGIARLHAWAIRCPAALLHCCLLVHRLPITLPSTASLGATGHPVQCPEEWGKVAATRGCTARKLWKNLGEESELR
ncbi:uncharacterized protein K441DRAFT_653015 [Cenococcum geophilum 1.58]|uniref:uncharacterized protein n=1 Tax=Cenococcum geophilum 1.58 TaxID=794803 RepID=UPI00358F7398|nr:hypothetical protein K441DRAFT_653015 [Cenococcum geophilum 1.58]